MARNIDRNRTVKERIADKYAAHVEPPKTFDVRASCYEINGNGADGAYSLIGDGLTADEIGQRLVEVLKDGFGLDNGKGPFRLEINIGDAGQGDNLPL